MGDREREERAWEEEERDGRRDERIRLRQQHVHHNRPDTVQGRHSRVRDDAGATPVYCMLAFGR